MFCEKCGKELSDSDAFCTQCGSRIENAPVTKTVVVRNRNRIIAIAVAVVAIIIVAICIFGGGVNSSPEKVAVAYIESEYEIDSKKFVKCLPDFSVAEIIYDKNLPDDSSRSDVVDYLEERNRNRKPQDVKIIDTEVKELDLENYIIFRELYHCMTEEDEDNITAAARVTVTFELDGEEEKEQITCIEMDNKWYLLIRV